MASPPSASALSRSICRNLSLRGPAITVRFMKAWKGAHVSMAGMRLTASTARRQLRSMSSCRSTSCFTASLLSLVVRVFSRGSTSFSRPASSAVGSDAATLASMRWQGLLTSGWSFSPLSRCDTNTLVSSWPRQLSSRMSRHSNAALRSSRPSSILCLNGPRSTVRIMSSRTTVCSYSLGSSAPRCMATRATAFWWATALRATTAARRTWRSGSLIMDRKSSTQRCRCSSTGWGFSTTVYLMAETTTVRTLAEGDEMRCCSAASTLSGCSRARWPRHSATTLRHSSSASQLLSSRVSTCSVSLADKSILACPTTAIVVMTSDSACSSRYCCLGAPWVLLI
mmetsp:Transcript_33217/g.73438  ORF Transcript_33217/g.73438 Transcript_33217/m.73438 type:complete len:340 (-) Transcript_33217:387-1406(-)